MRPLLRPLIVLFIVLTVVTGVVYPVLCTGLGMLLFPEAAKGSIVSVGGRAVGSTLIGQAFQQPKYFWSRPSATAPMANNGMASGGSNFGPLNPALQGAVEGRIEALRAADPGNQAPVPVDLVTASGSGLDPDISPAAALYQVPRIARIRQLSAGKVRQLVLAQVEPRQWGLFGESRVNVLLLNLALDRAQ
jgi:K+-transporting ATPase ATPase C chain